ncbi:hypothetical protein D9M71_313380 [compost metagenome]
MGQGQIQTFAGNRRFQGEQIVSHAQGVGQHQAGVALVEHVVGALQQKLLVGLGQAGDFLELEVFPGETVEAFAEAVLHQGAAGVAAQVIPTAVGECLVALHPDNALGFKEGRMHVVHGFQARKSEEGPGNQIDPAGADFILGAGPGTGVEDVHLQSEFFGDLLEQVGVGAYQLLGVLRVAPEVGRVLGIAGGHQALALPGRVPESGKQAQHEEKQ